jgi:hypothetical protein
MLTCHLYVFFSNVSFKGFGLFKIFIYLFIFVLGGVHSGIYKSSYNITNISYLNSPLGYILIVEFEDHYSNHKPSNSFVPGTTLLM